MAQERTALLSAERRIGLPRIVTVVGPRRIDDHPLAGALAVQVDLIPVAAPLPDVASHVVQAVAVGRKRLHRRRALVAVPGGILPRELALPAVALRLRLGERLVAPGVGLALQPATGGELPPRLGRQAPARP